MKCVNCQFQNMPGSVVCGRCGTSLGLATATAIDVHPPRAGRWRQRLRKAFPARRAYFNLRDAAERSRSLKIAVPRGELLFLLGLAIPAWPQFHTGRRIRGHLFLWSFLAFLLPGLLMLGTVRGSVLLGLAFSVHTSGALDAVMLNFADCGYRDRWARAILVSAAIGLLVYLPLGVLLDYVASPRTIRSQIGTLSPGDIVLVNAALQPRPGRLVLYDVPEIREDIDRRNHGVFRLIGGPCIERILAGPGDHVRLEGGALFVNGKPCPWRPVGTSMPTKLYLDVPDGCWFILPAVLSLTPLPDDHEAWERVSLVPFENMHGTPFLRTHPLNSWSIIR